MEAIHEPRDHAKAISDFEGTVFAGGPSEVPTGLGLRQSSGPFTWCASRGACPKLRRAPNVAHILGNETPESRRDSITQPRVARHELPWVWVFGGPANPNGVAWALATGGCNPPPAPMSFIVVGVEANLLRFSQGTSCLPTLG